MNDAYLQPPADVGSTTNLAWSPEGIHRLISRIFTLSDPNSELYRSTQRYLQTLSKRSPVECAKYSPLKVVYGIAGSTDAFEKSFLERVQEQSANFTVQPDISKLNADVARLTDGMLNDVVDPQMTTHATFVVSAFKDRWAAQMKKESAPIAFTTVSGNKRQVPGFRGKVMAVSSNDKQLVAMLQYNNQRFMAVVVLPRNPKAAVDFNSININGIFDGSAVVQTQNHEIVMPNFDVQCRVTLDPWLKRQGIAGTKDLFASWKKQDPSGSVQVTRITVDEEGTRAASFTAVATYRCIQPVPETIVVDRPFGFLILDRSYQAIEFAAVIGDPHPDTSSTQSSCILS